MDINTLFANILNYIVSFVFFIPIQILKLIGAFLPTCSQLGIVTFSNNALNDAIQWMRFAWPVLQFLPWDVIWGLVSAELLLLIFFYLLDHLPMIMNFIGKWWWLLLALFLFGGIITTFIGNDWRSSPAFTDIFGTAPTSTGFAGGGFGGGGGGSW